MIATIIRVTKRNGSLEIGRQPAAAAKRQAVGAGVHRQAYYVYGILIY